jgi:hypothetical protein
VFNPTSPPVRVLFRNELQGIPGGNAIPVTYKIVDIASNSSGYAPYIVMDIWTDAPGGLEAPELYYADNTPVGPVNGVRSDWLIAQARALERAAANGSDPTMWWKDGRKGEPLQSKKPCIAAGFFAYSSRLRRLPAIPQPHIRPKRLFDGLAIGVVEVGMHLQDLGQFHRHTSTELGA